MSESSQPIPDVPGLLKRPVQMLQNLPVEYRWQFTRRHPYYLTFWASAHRFYAGPATDQSPMAKAAVAVLLAIGVTGDPPPPSCGPEALQAAQLATAWLGGAVAPVTYRAMAGNLLQGLPAAAQRLVGEALIKSADLGAQDQHSRFDLMLNLMTHQDPSLDTISNRPMVGINVNASQRAILEAIDELVGDWKKRQGITEHRRRDEMFDDYLSAWDLREGWVDDHYEIERELSFHEIAKRTGVPVRTAANRYSSAFRLVAGHEYSFRNWWLLFAVEKVFTRFGPQTLRRRRIVTGGGSGSAKTVPESVLRPKSDAPGGFLSSIAGPDDWGAADDFMDVEALIARGRTDNQILDELQFDDPKKGLELIEYLRSRAGRPSP